MKILLSVTVLSFTLALCHGACFSVKHKVEIKDGEPVFPTECTDLYDGSKHPFGSAWNTAKCLTCRCYENGSGMSCCDRYGGVAVVEGCVTVKDPETCQYKFHKKGDPSKPCH
ncbi:small serum protein 5-like [Rhineura floridana]|uniref:small serum protein 5-like n=1 Tax=Rhineura floridana TaxID=261503 RepID=UPI002AC8612B|nr:small serum protein 5-like [Rhineura floridana]